MDVPVYRFVVRGDDDQWHDLELRLFDEAAATYLSKVWRRLSGAVEEACVMSNTPTPSWVKWKPWDWCGSNRPDYADRIAWVAWCGTHLAGFVNVWHRFPSQYEAGKLVLYIEHIAAFPGDQNTELWRRRYRYVGQALIAFTIKLSSEAGCDGRIGLHSENDHSLAFYKKIADKRNVALFHQPEKNGIIGPTPHGARSDGNRLYLETTAAGATDFLEDYRNG